jgi:hypothetical protein
MAITSGGCIVRSDDFGEGWARVDAPVLAERAGEVLQLGAAAGVSCLSDEALMDAARCLERSRSLLDTFEGHVVAELEFRGSTLIDSGTRTSSFLAEAGGRAKAECRQRVRHAVSLRSHLDVLDSAVVSGSISSAHAQAVVAASNPRILDQLKDLQSELIELAGTTTFDRWKRHLLELCSLLDQDGGYEPAADPCANKLTVRETGDGVALKGQLFGEAAEVARSAIGKLADELHRQFAADREQVGPEVPRPRRETLNALALVELCRRAMAVSVDSSVPPHPDRPDRARRCGWLPDHPHRRWGTPPPVCSRCASM